MADSICIYATAPTLYRGRYHASRFITPRVIEGTGALCSNREGFHPCVAKVLEVIEASGM